MIAKKDTRYVEYAAEAVIDSWRSFHLEDDEDNEFKSGGSGIFSTAFKQRGVTDKPRETSSLESFVEITSSRRKSRQRCFSLMSNEASLRRYYEYAERHAWWC